MQKNFKISLIIAVSLLMGCAAPLYVAKYTKAPVIKLDENVPSTQTIGGITIDLSPFDEKEYEKPIYSQKVNVTYTPFLQTVPVTEPKEYTKINLFWGYTAFYVTVKNSTDHILRMKDSRVVFIEPNNDEPYAALDKAGIQSDFASLPIYKALFNIVKNAYPNTNDVSLNADIAVALTNISKGIKFINGFDMEIMPGMKASGILLFPISPEKLTTGKISFVDMVSKTDAAGTPTEKVRFDYKTKLFYNYWKSVPTGPTGIITYKVIDANEFNKGLVTPEKYQYDKTIKDWKIK